MRKNCTYVFLLFSVLFSFRAAAQEKIAYVNMQQLVAVMPEVRKAEDSLRRFAVGLDEEGKGLYDDYNRQLKAFETGRSMTQLQALNAAQQRVQTYQDSAQQVLAQREQTLMTPIIAKAKKAVSDLAKEKGYTYVLDNSNGMVISSSYEDIFPIVKSKLGIN